MSLVQSCVDCNRIFEKYLWLRNDRDPTNGAGLCLWCFAKKEHIRKVCDEVERSRLQSIENSKKTQWATRNFWKLKI